MGRQIFFQCTISYAWEWIDLFCSSSFFTIFLSPHWEDGWWWKERKSLKKKYDVNFFFFQLSSNIVTRLEGEYGYYVLFKWIKGDCFVLFFVLDSSIIYFFLFFLVTLTWLNEGESQNKNKRENELFLLILPYHLPKWLRRLEHKHFP